MSGIKNGLYVIGGTGGNLYTMDCVTGSLSAPILLNANLLGIAFFEGASFAITSTHFGSIDPEHKTFTVIGSLGFSGAQSLAVDSNGQVYCLATPPGSGTGLYSINVSTGSGVLIGLLAPAPASVDTGSAGLAFDSNDQLYSTLTSGTTSGLPVESLVTIDVSTGAISTNLPGTVFSSTAGLAFLGGNLYGITTDGILFTINVATGTGTKIGGIKNDALGLLNLASRN